MTTVGEAMLSSPKVCAAEATAEDLWALFADDHIHAALVTDAGRLLTVVERSDLAGAGATAPAAALGTLTGRTVAADADLALVHRDMLERRVRRLAVVDAEGLLLGLLCLKNSGTGFCSDHGVAARAAERAASSGLVPEYDAVVLAGGRSTRMGTDKTRLRVGGSSLVDRVRRAVADAGSVVVVGPEVDGGPVAALASALPRLSQDLVVTLAGDLPLVSGAIAPLLRALNSPGVPGAPGAPGADVAVLVAHGRRQYLAAAWRRTALAAAIDGLDTATNAPVRRLFEAASVVEVPDPSGWSTDVDTPGDLAAARALCGGRGPEVRG